MLLPHLTYFSISAVHEISFYFLSGSVMDGKGLKMKLSNRVSMWPCTDILGWSSTGTRVLLNWSSSMGTLTTLVHYLHASCFETRWGKVTKMGKLSSCLASCASWFLLGNIDAEIAGLRFSTSELSCFTPLSWNCYFEIQAYDDKMRAEAEANGDKRGIYKYSPESDLAITLMDDLKKRVLDSQEKVAFLMLFSSNDCAEGLTWGSVYSFLLQTIGVHMSYADPKMVCHFVL